MQSGIALRRAALVIAVVIAGLAVAQAIRHHSLEPIWLVGWIPAVLVGSTRACKPNRRPCASSRRRS